MIMLKVSGHWTAAAAAAVSIVCLHDEKREFYGA